MRLAYPAILTPFKDAADGIDYSTILRERLETLLNDERCI